MPQRDAAIPRQARSDFPRPLSGDGSYRISGVAPGQVVVRAQRIGYEARTDTV